jgi:hypothetical protein
MKRSIFIYSLFIILIINANENYSKPATDSISFEFLKHLILVKAKINESQKDYNLVIDTGGLTFIDKNVAQELNLKQRGIMAKIDTLDLSGFKIGKIFCFTTFNFQPFKKLGTPIHGIIGSNLLERFKVTFDFKSCLITFSSDTSSIEPVENGIHLSFRNHPVNNAPLIKFTLNQKIIEGMIDTGQPFPLVLPLNTFDEYKDTGVYDFIKSKGLMEKWPNTSADFNYLARLKSFELENIKIDTILCLFGELPQLLSMPLIGNDFLSHFKIIINYPKDEMMLIPYPDMYFKNNEFSIGINPGITADNKAMVEGIWENSPADKANIQVGDIIVSFNSQQVTPANLIELMKIMENDNAKSIKLEIENKDGKKEVTLTKVMLF